MALVLLGILAQALVPRASWYAHRHADGGHDHVHAWDGTRVAGSTASLRDFLPHTHDHGDEHAHDGPTVAAHVHGDAHAAPAPRASSARGRGTTGPALVAARDGMHAHGQAPFQIAVAADVARIAEPQLHPERAPDCVALPAVVRTHAIRARAPPFPRA